MVIGNSIEPILFVWPLAMLMIIEVFGLGLNINRFVTLSEIKFVVEAVSMISRILLPLILVFILMKESDALVCAVIT
jgi:hypothetical protein